jgi:hypothetical protein
MLYPLELYPQVVFALVILELGSHFFPRPSLDSNPIYILFVQLG